MGKLVRSPSRTNVIIVALLWWVDFSTGDERTMAWGVHWEKGGKPMGEHHPIRLLYTMTQPFLFHRFSTL